MNHLSGCYVFHFPLRTSHNFHIPVFMEQFRSSLAAMLSRNEWFFTSNLPSPSLSILLRVLPNSLLLYVQKRGRCLLTALLGQLASVFRWWRAVITALSSRYPRLLPEPYTEPQKPDRYYSATRASSASSLARSAVPHQIVVPRWLWRSFAASTPAVQRTHRQRWLSGRVPSCVLWWLLVLRYPRWVTVHALNFWNDQSLPSDFLYRHW